MHHEILVIAVNSLSLAKYVIISNFYCTFNINIGVKLDRCKIRRCRTQIVEIVENFEAITNKSETKQSDKSRETNQSLNRKISL